MRGGLGGALSGGAGCVSSLSSLSSASWLRSVGFGVNGDFRASATFSLLWTASFECSLLNDGYGKLVLDPYGEERASRRSISGTTDILREE